MAQKNKTELAYQFKKLEKGITSTEGEILLNEFIGDWRNLAARFSLNGEEDNVIIKRCQFYVKEIINKFPELELKYLHYYYDDAMADFLGVKYVPKKDRKAQEKLGYNGLIFQGKSLYLFPLE